MAAALRHAYNISCNFAASAPERGSIYNAPLEYADLILNGDPKKCLKAVTVYRPFEN